MKRKMTPEERELRNQAATPLALFQRYHERYHFTVDACAVGWNAKLPRFWSPAENGLQQNWVGERLWINPPYGEGLIQPWVERVLNIPDCSAAMLLPARTDMQWFHDLWWGHERGWVKFEWHKGRLHFLPPAGIKYTSPNERHFVALVRL